MQARKSVSNEADYRQKVGFCERELALRLQLVSVNSQHMLSYLQAVSMAVEVDNDLFKPVVLIQRLPIDKSSKSELIRMFANRCDVTHSMAAFAWHSARKMVYLDKLHATAMDASSNQKTETNN